MPAAGSRATDVLLIEDDPHAASLFLERTTHFAPGEFRVTQARSLHAALEEAYDTPYSLAVLDLTLPDSSGIETCARFSKAQPGVPFIVLTGVSDDALIETLSKAGAKAALLKDDCSGYDIVNAMRTARAVTLAEQQETPAAMRALAESRFRNAIIDKADGIVVIDLTGNVLLVSTGAETLLGRAAADLTGSPFGIDLKPGTPVRAQTLREESRYSQTHSGTGPVLDFDVCQLHVSEVEFWPFAHQWSGKPVIVCAMRDISNQSVEELRQQNIVKIVRPLEVGAGIDAVCTDLALRLGMLVQFNRFEVSVWMPQQERLQVVFELGTNVKGREVSSILNRSAYPDEFGAWATQWSPEDVSPRIALSIGNVTPLEYSKRDEAVLARCANMVAAALSLNRAKPVFSVSSADDDSEPLRAPSELMQRTVLPGAA